MAHLSRPVGRFVKVRLFARRAFVWDPFKFRCPFSVRSPSSGYFGSFMLVDRHRRQHFWTHMFKQNLMTWKIGQKKTEFKQERNDRPKSVFEKFLKNFPQAMDARKYRIVFYWIHMFGVKPHKNQHFQPENTSNTSDWRVRTNLNGTAQKPWGPPLPRGCNLVNKGGVSY